MPEITGNSDPAAALRRIRAMLAKAQATEFDAERESLTARAAEMMARYGIDRARLAASGEREDRRINKRNRIDPPYAMDQCVLYHNLAKALRCDTVRLPVWDEKTRRKSGAYDMHTFGYESDVERLEILFGSLLQQAATGLQRAAEVRGPADARTWLGAFTSVVCERIRAAEWTARHDAEADGSGMEVVLMTREQQVAADVAAAYKGGLVVTKRRLSGSREAARAGREAGRNADIGNTRIGTRDALRSAQTT